MTLDEAIKHATEVALKMKRDATYNFPSLKGYYQRCDDCADEHYQLVDWLEELKQLREENRWIPVSEKLPPVEESILICTEHEQYVAFYEDGSRHRTESLYHQWDETDGNGNIYRGWYSFNSDYEVSEIWGDVIAWRPLPKPYRVEEGENEME